MVRQYGDIMGKYAKIPTEISMKGNNMGFLSNRIIQILLVVCVIIAICIIAGLNFHVNAGSNGVSMGVERK